MSAFDSFSSATCQLWVLGQILSLCALVFLSVKWGYYQYLLYRIVEIKWINLWTVPSVCSTYTEYIVRANTCIPLMLLFLLFFCYYWQEALVKEIGIKMDETQPLWLVNQCKYSGQLDDWSAGIWSRRVSLCFWLGWPNSCCGTLQEQFNIQLPLPIILRVVDFH